MDMYKILNDVRNLDDVLGGVDVKALEKNISELKNEMKDSKAIIEDAHKIREFRELSMCKRIWAAIKNNI